MVHVNKSNCTQSGDTLVLEASTLQLTTSTACWPSVWEVADERGQVELFGPVGRAEVVDGEVTGVRYYSRSTKADLLVIND